MPTPQNRDRTYTSRAVSPAGAQVRSADLNSWQDQLIANFRGKAAAISPAAISGTVNNWDPTGLDIDVGGGTFLPAAQVVRVSLSANVNLNGIARGIAGRMLEIVLVSSGGWHLDLIPEAGASTAANRLLLPGAVQRRLYGDGSRALLWYDGTSSRWRVVAVHTNAGDHGTEVLQISPFAGVGNGDNWAFSTSGCLASANGGGGLQTRGFGINLLVGSVIEAVHATVRGNAGGVLTMSLRQGNVGGDTSLGSAATVAAATDQDVTVSGLGVVVAIGENYYLRFQSNNVDLAYRIYEMSVTYRRRGKDGT